MKFINLNNWLSGMQRLYSISNKNEEWNFRGNRAEEEEMRIIQFTSHVKRKKAQRYLPDSIWINLPLIH